MHTQASVTLKNICGKKTKQEGYGGNGSKKPYGGESVIRRHCFAGML